MAESLVADGLHGGGDVDAAQGIAILEGIVFDGRQGSGELHGREAAAASEDTISYGLHGIGDADGGQLAAVVESLVADALQRAGQGDGGEGGVVSECRIVNGFQALVQGHQGEAGRTERPGTDGFHAARNVDGRQPFHAVECLIADDVHGAGNGDAGHIVLVVERVLADAGDGVGGAAIGDGGGNGDVARVAARLARGHFHLVGQCVGAQTVVDALFQEAALHVDVAAADRRDFAAFHGDGPQLQVARDGEGRGVAVAVGGGGGAVDGVVDCGTGIAVGHGDDLRGLVVVDAGAADGEGLEADGQGRKYGGEHSLRDVLFHVSGVVV